MLASTVFAIFALASSVCASTLVSQNTSALSFVPLSPIGVVASVQLTSSPLQTRLYYQDNNGNIIQHVVAPGPYTTAHTTSHNLLVNAAGALWGTPIAASGIKTGSLGIHIYYLDRNRVLSERRFASATGWQPTANSTACPRCIQNAGFTAAEGSDVLYAEQDPENGNILRVGFVSTGAPGTLTEAVTTDLGATWVLAPLPA